MIYLIEHARWEYIAFTDALDAINYVENMGCIRDTSPAVLNCIEWFGPEVLHYKTPEGEKVRLVPIKLVGDRP